MKIMAIDYGDAHTGIAISDATGTLAGFSTVINSRRAETVAQEICALIPQHGVTELVLGYPKNMDGTVGPRAEKAAAFGQTLRQLTGLPVTLWDERRTTIDAHNILFNNGQNAKKRKKTVDAVAAALMLGAEGVQMGTRFVATTECQVHPNYKEKVLKARDIDTRVTGRTTGHPVRALRNEMTKKYLEMEAAGATAEELEYLTLGGLRKAVVEGDVKNGSVMSGQIAGLVKDELPCKEVIENIMAETGKALKGAAQYE